MLEAPSTKFKMSLAAADPMIPHVYTVRSVKRETDDTFTLELAPNRGRGIGPFQPGQFNMLYVFGVGEIPISISSDPRVEDKLQHTTRAVGTVTKAMNLLGKGDSLGVRGPFGSWWPVEEAYEKDVVIVTGGIGLAPLRPAIYSVIARRAKFHRLVILYGARTPDDLLFVEELREWKSAFDIDVFVTVDRGTPDWHGFIGFVTTLVRRAPFDAPNTVALVCGPEVMMRYSVEELRRRGVRTDNIYVSMERNMKCAVGFCGHCQFGPTFICKDGPVFRFDRVERLFEKREL